MAGGTWDFQNKKQPGVYIKFKSSPTNLASIGDRGVVALATSLDWGSADEIIAITSLQEVYAKLGYDITNEKMRFVQQIFRGSDLTKGASKLLVYRLNGTGGVAATGRVGGLTIVAKAIGIRGNDITVIFTPDIDTEYSDGLYAVYIVETVVDGIVQNSQKVGTYISDSEYVPAKIGDLNINNWVTFQGEKTSLLLPSSGIPLTGGANPTITNASYANFLTALEPFAFNILIYDGEDASVRNSYINFVQRLSFESGRYCQLVASDCPNTNSECVISVKNGYFIGDTEYTKQKATWWVGGVEAGAANYQSLTYAIHPEATKVSTSYAHEQLDQSIDEGSLTFIEEYGAVKIMTDINTFTSFAPEKNESFSKNQAIRVLWSIANDIYMTLSKTFVGKVPNTEAGRNLYKQEIIGYMKQLQGNGAIQNLVADDVVVAPGGKIDAIIINVAVQIAHMTEKIYIGVTIS